MSARVVAYELHRTWREGWDVPGSSGYDSYIMAHRNMRELFPDHKGSMVELAKQILAEPIPHDQTGTYRIVS